MTPLISINNVCLKLPGMTQPILKNINYNIYDKDFIVLLGHNGSGKSSLLKVLDRRYCFTQGSISLEQKTLENYSQQQLSQLLTTLTQNHQESLFGSLTVLENHIITKQVREKTFSTIRIKSEKRFLSNYLHEFNQNLSSKLDVQTSNLSGGEQQALTLALSTLCPPKILLLDEHTSALDPLTAEKLIKITAKVIHKHGITCILSTHNLDLAMNYGNRILALANGEVVQRIEPEQKKYLKTQDLLRLCY